jgi:hypothetical protein
VSIARPIRFPLQSVLISRALTTPTPTTTPLTPPPPPPPPPSPPTFIATLEHWHLRVLRFYRRIDSDFYWRACPPCRSSAPALSFSPRLSFQGCFAAIPPNHLPGFSRSYKDSRKIGPRRCIRLSSNGKLSGRFTRNQQCHTTLFPFPFSRLLRSTNCEIHSFPPNH